MQTSAKNLVEIDITLSLLSELWSIFSYPFLRNPPLQQRTVGMKPIMVPRSAKLFVMNSECRRTTPDPLSDKFLDDYSKFKQIKFWILDRFLAKCHVATCPRGPIHIRHLQLCVKKVTRLYQTSEQVISSFRD